MQNFEETDLTKASENSFDFYIHKKDLSIIPSKSMHVFYNKKMELNRDISILAILAYNKIFNNEPLNVVDSMAASGIGSIRLFKSSDNIETILFNDINPLAIKIIEKNLKLNDINKKKVILTNIDANLLFINITQRLIQNKYKINFHPNIIMIDPFGTPNLYIDSALKAIKKKDGLLCITATDTPVLFGVRSKACLRKYMSKPLHNEYCKEIGARILIYFISRIANLNNLSIRPILTFYSNHFIRIFVLTSKNKENIHEIITKNYGFIIHCMKCGYRISIPNNPLDGPNKCPNCGESEKIDYSGPIWKGELHDPAFLKEVNSLNAKFEFSNKKKIDKIIKFACEEIGMPISYYNIHKLCQKNKLPNIPKIEELMEILEKKGFTSSRTHFDFTSFKTDANIAEIEKILKTYD
jgi:tRNA (guanine26-N2/guanine27-N2)-dimethyltransferase